MLKVCGLVLIKVILVLVVENIWLVVVSHHFLLFEGFDDWVINFVRQVFETKLLPLLGVLLSLLGLRLFHLLEF